LKLNESFVLLVEDREEDVELTLRAFGKAGVSNRVEVVRDGIEAIEFLEGSGSFPESNRYEAPAMMLVDINLPRLNGIQFVRRVRNMDRLRYVPVIMVTSSNEPLDLRASYDSGANSFVRKPVSTADFSSAISRICGYWLEINETPDP